MRVYGSVVTGGPMTGDSVPLPTAPVRREGDPFTDLEAAHRVRSPIGPSTKTRAELAALEQRMAGREPAPRARRAAGDGLRAFQRPRSSHSRARVDRDQVVALYQSGMSGTQIGEQLGCIPQTVYNHLSAAGVPRRTRSESRKKPIDEAAAAEAYAAGASLEAVARAFHCHSSTVREAVLAHGGRIRIERSRRTTDPTALAEAYASGQSLVDVAAQFHCSRDTVRRAVRAVGGTLRPPGPTNKPRARFTADPHLIAAYQSGTTIPALAAEVGRGPETVRRALRAAGVELRDDRVLRNGGRNRRDYRDMEADLCRTYVDEGASIEETAARLDSTPKVVQRALTRLGIPRRPAIARSPGDRAASVRQLMATNGVTAADVRTWARRAGVQVGARGIPSESAVRGYLAYLKGEAS